MFRIIPEGRRFTEYVLLRDGESVFLRGATPEDVPAVEALLGRASPESLQMRFMGAVSYVPRSFVAFMCSGEPDDRLALLAVLGQGEDARVIGIGNYVSLGVGRKAEVAFLVDDAFQGRGISTLILERLAGIAAAQGFIGFTAEVLYENQAMINVFKDSGFEVCQALQGGCVHVDFPVSGVATLRERAELRDRIAAANSLVPLVAPRSVAVVGASRDPSAVGSMIFASILRSSFGGTAYPVNREATSVHGVRAYTSLADLPERPDLVVIAVPADGVLEVARAAVTGGTKGLLVVTSGFAESGPEGKARQEELVALVRSHGARLIGPNCLGLMNTHADVRLNASLAPELPPRGRVGFFSHSAALGLVILKYAGERGLGFSTFVSAGNRADVSGNDLLRYWEEDASTDLALLYLETFGNPRRFARIARRLAYKKPILCVKSARSRAGRDAARAHIAASPLAEPHVDALFRQAGVLRAETLEEMFDTAVLLAHQPLPRGNRVAIVSNSGGILTICADACDAHGLDVAGPGAVDLGPLATVEAYEAAVQRALASPDVDALIAIFACVGACDPALVGRGIHRGVVKAERKSGVVKPVLLCLMGTAGAVQLGPSRAGARGASARVFPSYRFPESAALALSRAVQYALFRSEPAGRFVWYEDVNAADARQAVTAALGASGDAVVWIERERAGEVLEKFGIAVAPEPGGGGAPDGGTRIAIEIRSDASFGPLIRVQREGAPPLVRITPLTDRDVRELAAASGAPAGAEELLGRLSQLVEELPWLCGMEAELAAPAIEEGAARLASGVKLGLCRQESGPS